MLCSCCRTKPKLQPDKVGANAILNEVTIDLRWEMGDRVFQVFENQQPLVAGKCFDCLQSCCLRSSQSHFVILQNNVSFVKLLMRSTDSTSGTEFGFLSEFLDFPT